MNKNDKILLIVLIPILLIILLTLRLSASDENKVAYVYYENDVILKIDLNNEEKEYVVKGYNGDVKLKAGNGRIKVISETSEKHLCSRQGYISASYETIICLPNKIVIKIVSDGEFDATM